MVKKNVIIITEQEIDFDSFESSKQQKNNLEIEKITWIEKRTRYVIKYKGEKRK